MIPFISVEDLNAQLGIEADPDALLTAIVLDAACQLIRDDIRQDVNQATDDVEIHDGTGLKSLILNELPIIEVTKIEEDGDELEEDSYVVDDSGIVWRVDGLTWTAGRQNIAVTYDHGWALSEADVKEATGTARAIERVPSSIRLVALNVAARIYRGVGDDPSGEKTSENFGIYSFTRSESANDLARTLTLTSLEQTTLNRWRQPS